MTAQLICIGSEDDGKAIVIEPTKEYLDVRELLRTLKREFVTEWFHVHDEIETGNTLELQGELPRGQHV